MPENACGAHDNCSGTGPDCSDPKAHAATLADPLGDGYHRCVTPDALCSGHHRCACGWIWDDEPAEAI